jgi:hypothetical protein
MQSVSRRLPASIAIAPFFTQSSVRSCLSTGYFRRSNGALTQNCSKLAMTAKDDRPARSKPIACASLLLATR